MKNIRSAFGFLGVVALMSVFIVGAVILAKNRDQQYANQAANSVSQQTDPAQPPQQEQPKDAAQQPVQNQPVTSPPAKQEDIAPIQAATNPQEAPKTAQPQKTTPTSVPSTGPSDSVLIALVAMATTYFLVSMLRMKSLYKRA